MTADSATTLVWLAPLPPDPAQARALAAWGRARGLAFVPPSEERPVTLSTAAGLADPVDDQLDRARDAITERDGAAADRALESAEQTLRAHPELPNAAWLMAEVERSRSMRFRLVPPADRSAADRAWLRAEALDGGRIAGVGEESGALHAQPATLVLEPPPSELARLDGVPAARGMVATRVGPHALVLTWNGAPVWATWIDVGPGSSAVSLPSPAAPPCSVADLANVQAGRGAVLQVEETRCPRWAAATTGLVPDAVRIASCEGGRCGALLDWRTPPPWNWSPPTARPSLHKSFWASPWATGSVIGGAIAVGAGALAVIASGALKAPPAETRFVSGGLKTP